MLSELHQVHPGAADDCQPDASPSVPGCSSDKGSEHSAPCSPPCSPGHDSVFGSLQSPRDLTPCGSGSGTLWAVLRPRHIPTDSQGRTLLHYAVVGKVSCWQPLACWCTAFFCNLRDQARHLVGCSAGGSSSTCCPVTPCCALNNTPCHWVLRHVPKDSKSRTLQQSGCEQVALLATNCLLVLRLKCSRTCTAGTAATALIDQAVLGCLLAALLRAAFCQAALGLCQAAQDL